MSSHTHTHTDNNLTHKFNVHYTQNSRTIHVSKETTVCWLCVYASKEILEHSLVKIYIFFILCVWWCVNVLKWGPYSHKQSHKHKNQERFIFSVVSFLAQCKSIVLPFTNVKALLYSCQFVLNASFEAEKKINWKIFEQRDGTNCVRLCTFSIHCKRSSIFIQRKLKIKI